jgi:hypothetical protein
LQGFCRQAERSGYGVSGGTKVVKMWRFEIPFSSG